MNESMDGWTVHVWMNVFTLEGSLLTLPWLSFNFFARSLAERLGVKIVVGGVLGLITAKKET